jgi:ADP-heptose:LPS heptosyltransferase
MAGFGNLAARLPFVSRGRTARGLILRADAQRDTGRFAVAAALYAEALRLRPSQVGVRIQLGNMLKDAGDLAGAEAAYRLAQQDRPDDADIAVQLGHVHKLAGRTDDAIACYRHALILRPGWDDAARELAAIGIGPAEPIEADDLPDWAVPELLPRPAVAVAAARVEEPGLRLFRFGRRPRHARFGATRVLHGVEAIRGACWSNVPLADVRLLIDGALVQTDPLQAWPRDGGLVKYVFNLWHDFSAISPGPHQIEIALVEPSGRIARHHRETLCVHPPVGEADEPQADAIVTAPKPDGANAAAAVNARPSAIREVERRILPDPIRTILVQRIDQLGDLVCSVPAIRRLRALFPDARLVGLVTAANVGLATALDLFDEIVTADFPESITEGRRIMPLADQERLLAALLPHTFDVAIDLGEGDQSRLLLLLSGAKFLYGFKERHSPWLDAGLEFHAHDGGNGNEVVPPSRKFVMLVEALDLMRRSVADPIPLPPDDQPRRPYAVVHAGTRVTFSKWPGFDALVALLLAQTDLDIVYFADDPASATALADAHPGRVTVIAGLIPFAELDDLLGRCALFVGNDSGPKHLAAMRGAPVVSIHIARNNWTEWGQEYGGRIVSRRVPCAGCGIGHDGEDCGKDYVCVRAITPEEVYAAAADLVGLPELTSPGPYSTRPGMEEAGAA